MAKKKTTPRRGPAPAPIRPAPVRLVTEIVAAPPTLQFRLTPEQSRTIANLKVEAHKEDYAQDDWTHYLESPSINESRRPAGNPVHAWRAYLECRGHNLPIPDWVLSYFDRVAGRFWALSSAGTTLPRDISATVAEALEMKRPGRGGAGNVFAAYDRREEGEMAMEAAFQINLLDGQRKLAFKRVAKARNVSPSKVERAFNAWREDLEAEGVITIKK
jgi:hypothetical protein